MHQPSVSFRDDRPGFDWRTRLRAATIHLALSALVAALAGLLVFVLWYPYPYREVSGGRELFQLVVAVDVALGPLITFSIFNRAKPRAELMRDLAVVALLQLAGLAYGLWTVSEARPVHLVYELDRFRVVHRTEIPDELLARTPPGIDATPLGGPTLLAVRPLADREQMEATLAALSGLQIGARPDLWQPYAAARAEVLAAARPAAQLKTRFPHQAAAIDAAARQAGRDPARVAWLPLVSRNASFWTVLLDASTAEVIGYLPLDSF